MAVPDDDPRVTSSSEGAGTPMRICPRGCDYREVGRRSIMVESRWHGRGKVRERFEYEATHCPHCGRRLRSRCERCGKAILVGAQARCRYCGLPYPWARAGDLVRSLYRDWKRTAKEVYTTEDGARRLAMYAGDLARIKLDHGAIVSTDDTDGAMWSDVAHAIKTVAGPEVERQSVDGGEYPMGAVWRTEPGTLNIESILHVAAMHTDGSATEADVEQCATAALGLARDTHLATVALPAIGSGTSGLDVKACVCIIVEQVREFFASDPGSVRDVVLVLFERPDFEQLVVLASAHARGESVPPPTPPGRLANVWRRFASAVRRRDATAG